MYPHYMISTKPTLQSWKAACDAYEASLAQQHAADTLPHQRRP